MLAEAGRQGVVLAGISAGMNCWFEGCSTDSYGPLATLPDGLGMLRGSACPHYDGEAEREGARAFHVEPDGSGGTTQMPLEVRLLG
ncbi:Type 1 glutamine amidotransferase-like domain-containing protein [Kytococcus sedentarius]|uniref:Type 1 glutamine amidotransferase-like domain-containing protein n=1 Tax=Kytococcus sedentarius TaxID=1276 RepID=UPI0022AA6D3E|nr:Type 1 glutamine amidotransferase-like domain-containing protein [Kytococcus sedentarius]